MIKQIREDFMKTPKVVKAILAILLLVSIATSVTACISYGPSKEFVEKMEIRASENFPAFERFIEMATPEQLESAYNKPGAWSRLGKDELDELKKVKILELKAWRFLISETKKLTEKE